MLLVQLDQVMNLLKVVIAVKNNYSKILIHSDLLKLTILTPHSGNGF